MDFAERLRAESADVWDAMQAHRFVRDVEQDRLAPDVLRRYFVIEHGFVETALLIHGHALLKAPGLPQRRHLVRTLHALSEGQLAWFRTCFATLGIEPPGGPPPLAVLAFRDGMVGVAERGHYAEIIAIMLAAQWMYATWCARADRAPSREKVLAGWVALHTGAAFIDRVRWLRDEIDREGSALDAAGQRRLSALFRHALELEIVVHEAAYERSRAVGDAGRLDRHDAG